MKPLVLTLLVGYALACPAASPDTKHREVVRLEGVTHAMGTDYRVAVYGDDENRLRSALEQASDEVRRLDQLLSNYVPGSEWSQVNRLAARQAVRVSPELFRLLSACLEYSRQSEGTFDITVGPLMRVWGFYKGTGHLPHRAEVLGALARVGYRQIVLDPRAQTVHFRKEGVEIDPGGIGKGYAVDRMIDVLKENGITTAMVSAGGSSMYGLGAPPSEPRGWRVDIRDPKDPSKTIQEVFLKNESMSTSGNYERFFYAEGRIYSHIMDPRTGYPAQGTLAVSVIAPRTLASEAWTKPYFILGRDWTARHKPKDFRVFFCEDQRGREQCEWLP